MQQLALPALCTLLLAAATPTQEAALPRRVTGTVQDEQGAPIAGARVRIEICRRSHIAGALASELRHAPLPHGVSTADGRWSLILTPAHDAFSTEVHGRLALVVEAPGRQPWRELLPNPPRLYDGSKVVLPKPDDADLATIQVAGATPGALVLLQRFADEVLSEGGPPPGERQLLEVPADGVLRVAVPIWPNPPCVATTGFFTPTGWTAQLLQPGASSEARPLGPAQRLVLTAEPAEAVAASDHPRASRCLRRLPDDSLRWFAANDGAIVDDPRLPVVAIELLDGALPDAIVAWPAPETPTASASSLQFVDQAGKPVHDVRIDLYRPEELVWTRLQAPRPTSPASRRLATRDGKLVIPADLGAHRSGWLQAPNCEPRLLFDVRLASVDGCVTLQRASHELKVIVRDDQGDAISGAKVFVSPQRSSVDDSLHSDGLRLGADDDVPVTDDNGRCVLAEDNNWPFVRCVAPGWHFDWPQIDAPTHTAVVTGHRVHPFAAHVVDAAGAPVPFANVGYEVWVKTASGSRGSIHTAMADSRGIAHVFGDASRSPRVRAGEMGHYSERGGVELHADQPTEVHVERPTLVAIVVPQCSRPFANFVMGWDGIGRTTSGGTRMPTQDGHALLMGWPEALPLWAQDADGGPPVVVLREDAANAPRHVLDRRAIVRQVPLLLTGAVPGDLAGMRSAPASIGGHVVPASNAFDADYLATQRDGTRLTLTARDRHQHFLWLLHPEVVPHVVLLPQGEHDQPITAELQRGAPCTLSVKLQRTPYAGMPMHLVLRRGKNRLGHECLAPLHAPSLCTDAALQGVELQQPFALAPGEWRIELQSNIGLLAEGEVTIADTAPVKVTLQAPR